MGRRGRKRKQLIDDLKENSIYWNLKYEVFYPVSGEFSLEETVYLSQEAVYLSQEAVYLSQDEVMK